MNSNITPECERVRVTLMASLDGETGARSAADQAHLSTCVSCQQWLEQLQSMSGRLQELSYPRAQMDLWTAVEGRIAPADRRLGLSRWVWPIGGVVLGWRALQLFVDLPAPLLHPLVPLAAIVAVVWLIVGDPLAIETSAPELQNRGV